MVLSYSAGEAVSFQLLLDHFNVWEAAKALGELLVSVVMEKKGKEALERHVEYLSLKYDPAHKVKPDQHCGKKGSGRLSVSQKIVLLEHWYYSSQVPSQSISPLDSNRPSRQETLLSKGALEVHCRMRSWR